MLIQFPLIIWINSFVNGGPRSCVLMCKPGYIKIGLLVHLFFSDQKLPVIWIETPWYSPCELNHRLVNIEGIIRWGDITYKIDLITEECFGMTYFTLFDNIVSEK